jgi:hypothetical protein
MNGNKRGGEAMENRSFLRQKTDAIKAGNGIFII